MGSCPACGAPTDGEARFCSRCGAAVGDEPVLLEQTSPAVAEDVVSYGRSGRFWATVAGGALLVLLGVWALSALGGAAGDATAGRLRPTTTTAPVAASTETTATSEATDPTEPSVDQEATTSTSMVGAGEPLLGQPVGLSLLIGSELRLRRVDLDTGVVTTYEHPATPVLAVGDRVLLQDPRTTAVRAVTVDQIDDPTVAPIWSQDAPAMPRPGPEPGWVWLPGLDADQTFEWRLVDLASGQLRTVVSSGTAPWWQGNVGWIDPEVVGSTDGGVFERAGDGYRRVADGELLAVSPAFVIVRVCADPSSCALRWVDRATWQEADRPVPEVDARQVGPIVMSDDGGLLLITSASGRELFDVARRTSVSSSASLPDNLAVSPDGRWVALTLLAGRISLYDTTRGESIELPISTTDGARMVFVPDN